MYGFSEDPYHQSTHLCSLIRAVDIDWYIQPWLVSLKVDRKDSNQTLDMYPECDFYCHENIPI